MKTAEVALLVSIFSAVLALCSIIWNVTVFVKSGPQVKASLSMGTKGPGPDGVGVETVMISVKAWARFEAFRSRADQQFFLVATNAGRAAVWVDSIGLCSSTEFASMSVNRELGEKDVGFGPGLPFKLDAGQTVRWAMPLIHAGSLCSRDEVPDSECIHGRLTLGSGVTLDSKEGCRVGLIREALGS